MANMSYCRFRNTLSDLRDCEDHMGVFYDEDGDPISKEEERAMLNLIRTCGSIWESYQDLLEEN